MELYIGRSRSWDARTYPRVGRWPLPYPREEALMIEYAELLVAAYATYDSWKQRSRNLDGYFVRAELVDADKLPEKVYVVLGAHPEKITWPGEWAPYRLRIDVEWWSERNTRPAFVSLRGAQDFFDECCAAKPTSRFMIVDLKVVS